MLRPVTRRRENKLLERASATDRERKEERLIEASLFSWLCNMIVLKPSLVSAPSLFLWVIKTNKPRDQAKTGSGTQKTGEIWTYLAQPGSVGESKTGCQRTGLWKIITHHSTSHHFTLTEQNTNATVYS